MTLNNSIVCFAFSQPLSNLLILFSLSTSDSIAIHHFQYHNAICRESYGISNFLNSKTQRKNRISKNLDQFGNYELENSMFVRAFVVPLFFTLCHDFDVRETFFDFPFHFLSPLFCSYFSDSAKHI